MAFSPSLLHPATASFHGQRLPEAVAFSSPRHMGYRGPVSVRAASSIVLVDKSESDKVNRLKTRYLEKIAPLLKEEFKYGNIHEIPKIEKIVVNCGIGDAAQNAKGLDAAVNELALVLGQRPIKTRARKSVATFKIREGMPLGIAATLRGKLMWSFLDRLINMALPRTRDFLGVSPNSFDGHGNYALGIQELTVFPEIKFDSVIKQRGLDVCIKTTAKTDKEGQRLLALMGMPFTEETDSTSNAPRKKKLKAHHFSMKGSGQGR